MEHEQRPAIELDRSWPACPHCTGGRVGLLTSGRLCEVCGGSGIDLSHPRLAVGIDTLPLRVCERKGLRRAWVTTLEQLVGRATSGGLRPEMFFWVTCVTNVRRYLVSVGLPAGPDLTAGLSATAP